MAPARGGGRRLRAGLLLAAAFAGQAAAQDKPRLRPKPLPQPSDVPAAASNGLSDLTGVGAPGIPSTAPSAAGSPTGRPSPPAPPPLVLRSAVHSRYSRPPVIARSTTGQCRAQCAVARTQCASGEADTGGCDPGWTQCLSGCDGLSYSRGP